MSGLLASRTRQITMTLFTGALGVSLALGAPAGFIGPADGTPAGQSKAYCGATLAGGKQPATGVTPVLFVHGFNSGPAMWTGGVIKTARGDVKLSVPKIPGSNETLVGRVASLGTTSALTFDYSKSNTAWVTENSIGPKLAKTISCLNYQTKNKVVVIAHSMGGLATQWSAGSKNAGGGGAGQEISAVVTMGTPNQGSWLAACAAKSQSRQSECKIADAMFAACSGKETSSEYQNFDPRRVWDLIPNSPPCKMLPDPKVVETPAGQALGNKNSNIADLPDWPTRKGSPKIHQLAGDLQFGLSKRLLLSNSGDAAVTVKSASAGAMTGETKHAAAVCPKQGRRNISMTCFHPFLHENPQLAAIALQVVKDSVAAAKPTTRQKVVDWYNRSYALTCDDLAKRPVRAAIENGKANIKRGALGGFDRWEVEIQRVTKGTLPRLGNVTAVLFACSPQPSNYYRQELRVYRSGDGTEMGRIPSFASENDAVFPPEYQPRSVTIKGGQVAADLKFYTSQDAHGHPSVLRHHTWTWNGHQFVKRSEVGSQRKPVDLHGERITVDGLGPVKIGMSRTDVAKAIGAHIEAEQPGQCSDVAVRGGPQGLRFRFAEDRLVAIAVGPPATTVKTASGLHIGSAQDDVVRTYGDEVSATSPDELVFAPTAPQFEGRIITFALSGDEVETFIAGEPAWATFLPCSD